MNHSSIIAAFAVLAVAALDVPAQSNGQQYHFQGQQYGANSIRNGDFRAAEAKLNDRLNADPADAFAMLNLAALYERTGRAGEAREMYQRVMAMRDNPYARLANRRIVPIKSVAGSPLESLEQRQQ